MNHNPKNGISLQTLMHAPGNLAAKAILMQNPSGHHKTIHSQKEKDVARALASTPREIILGYGL